MASQRGAVSQERCIVDVEYSRAAFASAERKRRARGRVGDNVPVIRIF